jgi:L-threonylcarbamoyladenylate synthase
VTSQVVLGQSVIVSDSGISADVVLRAARALRDGQVIAIPTDTVYGLAAAIDRPDAIERLYTTKGRPTEKAIPVLIADPADISTLTPHLSATAVRLASAFWPGALTLVVPALPGLPPGVTTVTSDETKTIAVRVPDNPVARAIIAAAGGALAVTSANRSGAAPAIEAREVSGLGLPEPLLVIDGGPAPGGIPSTIVAATAERAEILREGAISASDIAAALADVAPTTGDGTPAGYDQRMMWQQADNDSPETTS